MSHDHFPCRFWPFRLVVLGFLIALIVPARAGMTAFTDRGKIDFDTVMGLLNPYGTWKKTDAKWTFTPLDHGTPYTEGRWLYTEFGWTWQGRRPESWMTEHYGYWKRGSDHVWAWYPGPVWLPQTVEIRLASTAIGWRSAEVDGDGNFVETPSDRFTKTDEWTFVSLDQFARPITRSIITKPEMSERFLEESTDSMHSYLTYRQLDRPGPHPANFVKLGDGKMFAPMTAQDLLMAEKPAAKIISKSDVPHMQLVGTDQIDPNADTRQVKYWITMSLPTKWTLPPPDAKPNEIYLYRPDFYQDQDGIERRIALWLDPSIRATEAMHLKEAFGHVASSAHLNDQGTAGSNVGIPAAPASVSPPRDPFSSPLFNDTYHPTQGSKTPSASTKSPLSAGGAPVGTNVAPAPAATPAP